MKKEKDTLLIGRKEAMAATHEPAGPRWASLREEEPQRSRFYGPDRCGAEPTRYTGPGSVPSASPPESA